MKISEYNTDQIADLYVEIAPVVENITSGEHWQEISEDVSGDLNVHKMMTIVLPKLLKYNRTDVFAIIGAVNGKTAAEVAKQPFPQTLAEAREIITTDFTDFFTQSVSEDQLA